MIITATDLLNMLDRAIFFFRYGMTAHAVVSMNAFLTMANPLEFIPEIRAAADVGDYLRVADILEYKVRPVLA